MAEIAILTVNAGSSSLKISLFARNDLTPPMQILHGIVRDIGHAARFEAKDADGRSLAGLSWPDGQPSYEQVFTDILKWAEAHLGRRRLVAVGHRVVHGGRHLVSPVLIGDTVLDAIQALVPLAPLHQPRCLDAIRAVSAACPGLAQVACFDTAFHRTMPPVARRFALPRALFDEGVERYGFHGLSYEYIAGRLQVLDPGLAAGRCVVAHLGSGASLCALQAGRSVDTTMGLTALDGLPMGTRCGTVDPGVLLYLLQEKGLSPDALQDLLYHQSGLLGVSGETADMRELESSASEAALEAIELFAFQIARQVCTMACSMGGLEGLIFTGGIGENAPALRQMVCERLTWLGALKVLVIPTDEEAVIALHTCRVAQG